MNTDSIVIAVIGLLVAVAAALVLPTAIVQVAKVVMLVVYGVRSTVTDGFGRIGSELAAFQVRRAIDAEIAAEEKKRPRHSMVRRSAQLGFHSLHNVLGRRVGMCCEMQHFAAGAIGAKHMGELQDHDIATAYREAVLDYMDVAIERLGSANFLQDPAAAKFFIGLDAFHQACSDCELLQYQREKAPALCQPAMFMTGRAREQVDAA